MLPLLPQLFSLLPRLSAYPVPPAPPLLFRRYLLLCSPRYFIDYTAKANTNSLTLVVCSASLALSEVDAVNYRYPFLYSEKIQLIIFHKDGMINLKASYTSHVGLRYQASLSLTTQFVKG